MQHSRWRRRQWWRVGWPSGRGRGHSKDRAVPHPTPGTRRSAATRSRFQSPPRARVAQGGFGAVPGTRGPLRGGVRRPRSLPKTPGRGGPHKSAPNPVLSGQGPRVRASARYRPLRGFFPPPGKSLPGRLDPSRAMFPGGVAIRAPWREPDPGVPNPRRKPCRTHTLGVRHIPFDRVPNRVSTRP